MVEKIDVIRKEIITELCTLETKIRFLTSMNKNDFSLELENVMIPVLEILLDINLENANNSRENMKAIDLIDVKRKIGIQVTVQKSTNKIKDTISNAKSLYNEGMVKKLYIFVLTTKKYRSVDKYVCDYFAEDGIITINTISTMSGYSKLDRIMHYFKSYNKNTFDATYLKYQNKISRYFVTTKFYSKLKERLDRNRVAIVTGNAGIGKTFNCYKLFTEYINKGYIPVDLNNYQEILYKNEKAILFVDDFISHTSLEAVKYEEVNIIFDIIDNLEEYKNLIVLLNSRNKILKDFNLNNDRIEISKYKKHIIQLNEYTKVEKLLLLKNYLNDKYDIEKVKDIFEAKYSQDYCDTIINHKQFNPRLIENYTLSLNESNNIGVMILELLNNPDILYKVQFKQLTDVQKMIMKCLWLGDGEIKKLALINRIKKRFNVDSDDIHDDIEVLLDTYILISSELSEDDYKIIIYSAGVLDFLNKKYKEDSNIIDFSDEDLSRNEALKILNHSSISKTRKKQILEDNIDKLEYQDKIYLVDSIDSEHLSTNLLDEMNSSKKYNDDIFKLLDEQDVLETTRDEKVTKFNYSGLTKLCKLLLKDGQSQVLQELLNELPSKINNKLEDILYDYIEEYKLYREALIDFPFEISELYEFIDELIAEVIECEFDYIHNISSKLALNLEHGLSNLEGASDLPELLNEIIEYRNNILKTSDYEQMLIHEENECLLVNMQLHELEFIFPDFGHYLDMIDDEIITVADAILKFKEIIKKLNEIVYILQSNEIDLKIDYSHEDIIEILDMLCDGDYTIYDNDEIKSEYQLAKEKWKRELKLI